MHWYSKFSDFFAFVPSCSIFWKKCAGTPTFYTTLLERSMSITKGSFLKYYYKNKKMILKSVLRYSLLITKPCFTRKATPPLSPVTIIFIVS